MFGGFSPDSLAARIIDAESKFIITADEGVRGGRPIPLKKNTDEALKRCKGDEKVLVVRRTGSPVPWDAARNLWLHEELVKVDANCQPVEMSAEDPLFILYTSGSTGKPKAVVHTCGGYLVYTSITHQYVFDYHDDDIYWCTADVGWVTGHSYIIYGPLSNGATTLIFEGVPNYPTPSRFWHVVDKWDVNIFYTAPTAIRALMGAGDDYVKRTDRSSLKLLGTVGEPINPEAWEWYHRVVGDGRCPIVDTWWQTETGGILITPLPGATKLKPGSATRPFFGVQPALVDDKGALLEGAATATSSSSTAGPDRCGPCFETTNGSYKPTSPPIRAGTSPAMAVAETRTAIIGSPAVSTTSSMCRATGSAPPRSKSALVSHASVAEAAVVGYSHDIKGQGIYCYVTLIQGNQPSDDLKKELVAARAQGNRPARDTRPHSILAGPAEDAVGQDHAPHSEKDCGG